MPSIQHNVTKQFTDTTYVNSSGDTMTGSLVISPAGNLLIQGTGIAGNRFQINGVDGADFIFRHNGLVSLGGFLNIGSVAQPTQALQVLGNYVLTGNITISGDLTVSGTTTTINTATLEVTDKNILVNNGGTTAGAAGSGLDVEGDAGAVIGAIRFDNALASKFSIGNGTTQREIVDVSSVQTLTNKTIAGAVTTTTVRVPNMFVQLNSGAGTANSFGGDVNADLRFSLADANKFRGVTNTDFTPSHPLSFFTKHKFNTATLPANTAGNIWMKIFFDIQSPAVEFQNSQDHYEVRLRSTAVANEADAELVKVVAGIATVLATAGAKAQAKSNTESTGMRINTTSTGWSFSRNNQTTGVDTVTVSDTTFTSGAWGIGAQNPDNTGTQEPVVTQS